MLDRDLILRLEQQLRLMPELTLKLTEPQLDKTLVDCRLNYPQLEVPFLYENCPILHAEINKHKSCISGQYSDIQLQIFFLLWLRR